MISVYEYSNNASSPTNSQFYSNSNNLQSMSSFMYDEIYHHYHSGLGRREPKFLGFAIQDDNIEIDMEMAVPFLSVPKKRGVGTRSQNFANINVAAVILAGFVATAGILFGGATRYFNGGTFFDGKPFFRKKGNNRAKRDSDHHENIILDTMDNIDDALKGIGFDSAACMARTLCWHVKNSHWNVYEKKAGKIDIFIAGLSKSDLMHRIVSNSFLRDAIESGSSGVDCEKKYKECALNPNNVDKFTQQILQKAKPKKVKSHHIR